MQPPTAGTKRQRRQAAASVVQSLWSRPNRKKANDNATVGRPPPEVPPNAFGPIRNPNKNDVLCGRGGLINSHEGNVMFRQIVSQRKKDYNAKETKRNEKAQIAFLIVKEVRNMSPSGRFLQEDSNGLWYDIGDARAIRKTGQALREAGPSLRKDHGRACGKTDGQSDETNNLLEEKECRSNKATNQSEAQDDISVAEKPCQKESQGPHASEDEVPKAILSDEPSVQTRRTKPQFNAKFQQKTPLVSHRGAKRPSLQPIVSSGGPPTLEAPQANVYNLSQGTASSPQTPVNSPFHVTAMPRMSPGAIFSYYPAPWHWPGGPPVGYHYQRYQVVPPSPQVGAAIHQREWADNAFGRDFYPCPADCENDNNTIMNDVEESDTISGLTSSLSGEQRRELEDKHSSQAVNIPIKESEAISSSLQHSYTDLPAPGEIADLDSAAPPPRCHSLPDFCNLQENRNDASSNSTGGALFTSSSDNKRGNKKVLKLKSRDKGKMPFGEEKENSNATGSSESAKSEISVPSSYGNLSDVSDSFLALHLTEL